MNPLQLPLLGSVGEHQIERAPIDPLPICHDRANLCGVVKFLEGVCEPLQRFLLGAAFADFFGGISGAFAGRMTLCIGITFGVGTQGFLHQGVRQLG